jgi:hypothetical protein
LYEQVRRAEIAVGQDGCESRERLDLAEQLLSSRALVAVEQRQDGTAKHRGLLAPRVEPVRPRHVEPGRVERVQSFEGGANSVRILVSQRLAADQPVGDVERVRHEGSGVPSRSRGRAP